MVLACLVMTSWCCEASDACFCCDSVRLVTVLCAAARCSSSCCTRYATQTPHNATQTPHNTTMEAVMTQLATKETQNGTERQSTSRHLPLCASSRPLWRCFAGQLAVPPVPARATHTAKQFSHGKCHTRTRTTVSQ